MRAATRRWALALAAPLLLAACEADNMGVSWELAFADRSVISEVRAIEVCIVEGECPVGVIDCEDGPRTRFRDEHGFDGMQLVIAEGAERPPSLMRGPFGFIARARDERCRIVAVGCEQAMVPQAVVRVELLAPARITADCCGATCASGQCQRSDAGPTCADDGNPCTLTDCDAEGECIHTPAPDTVTRCPEPGLDPCRAAVCTGGVCGETEALPDGAGCPDPGADPCRAAVCTAGVCGETEPVMDGVGCPDPGADPCNTGVCQGGVCVERAPVANTPSTACTDPGADPCRSGICQDGVCREAAFLEGATCESDGDPCSQEFCSGGGCVNTPLADGTACYGYQGRCCRGRCTDIGTTSDCGGCFEACAPGLACMTRAGEGWSFACSCRSASDCPGTGRGWTCGAMSGGVGRCECEGMGTCTSPGTVCRPVGGSAASFCAYPS